LKMMDLFCGAGGLTLGFAGLAGSGRFESVFALDSNADAIRTYNANFGDHGVVRDIEEWLESGDVPKVDVVIGGPPCQGFSLLNKKRKGDERRSLWKPFMRAVEASGAKLFVIENVRELKSSPEFLEIEDYARRMGFSVWSEVLNAADFGAPQIRHRTFIVGYREDFFRSDFTGPVRTHGPQGNDLGLPVWRTVRDAIGDLPDPVKQEKVASRDPHELHFERTPTELSRQRYRCVPPGGNRFDLQKNAPHLTPKCWIRKKSGGTDLFGRLWWDRPSVTIRTEFFKPEKGRYLHPEKHRPITHREAARLMGFPDDFVFLGSKTEIAKQIGNAVPPPLAEAVADAVWAMFSEERKGAAA